MYIRYQDRLEMMEKAAFFRAIGKGVADIARMARPVGHNMMYHIKNIGRDLIHGSSDFATRGQAFMHNMGQMGRSLRAYGKGLSPEAMRVLKGAGIGTAGVTAGYGLGRAMTPTPQQPEPQQYAPQQPAPQPPTLDNGGLGFSG